MTHPVIAPLGANAEGAPAAPPVAYADLARMAAEEVESAQPGPWDTARRLMDSLQAFLAGKKLGDIGDLPPEQLANPADPDVGWGVIYHQSVSPAVRAEVDRLLKHRQGRLLPDWKPGHVLESWLGLLGISLINRDTADLPYYLLLVGGPHQIAFEYQYELDRIRAVGRLDLGDDPAAYRAYVDAVLAAEGQGPKAARRAVFAAARTDGDEATRLSADHLVPALAQLPAEDAALAALGFQVDCHAAATRDALRGALAPAGGAGPALVFLATHGLSFKSDDARLLAEQGAWICSDWQGGPVPRGAVLAGADVDDDFCLPGGIVFSLACFGAGASKQSEYARYYNRLQPAQPLAETVAPRSFTAALPQKLLSHRRGAATAAALACVGHVDLSWDVIFWDAAKQKADLAVFSTFVRRLLRGETVGMAAGRFSQLVDDHHAQLEKLINRATNKLEIADAQKAGGAWIARNNARGFVILGDPAVKVSAA
jgi:hypothetical protein